MRSLSMESRSADHHLKDESSVNTEMTANIKPGSFIVSEQKKRKKRKKSTKKNRRNCASIRRSAHLFFSFVRTADGETEQKKKGQQGEENDKKKLRRKKKGRCRGRPPSCQLTEPSTTKGTSRGTT